MKIHAMQCPFLGLRRRGVCLLKLQEEITHSHLNLSRRVLVSPVWPSRSTARCCRHKRQKQELAHGFVIHVRSSFNHSSQKVEAAEVSARK